MNTLFMGGRYPIQMRVRKASQPALRFPVNPVYSGIDTGMVNIDAIKITTQLLALLSELDEFKGA